MEKFFRLFRDRLHHARMRMAGAGNRDAGHEIEKNMKKSVNYQVRVRMNDGSYRTLYESAQPALAIGQKVRVTEQGISSAG